MTPPTLATVDFGGPDGAPLLICGPSLGTSVDALWSTTAQRLTQYMRVVGFDLPGHGRSPAPSAPFTIADIAAAVHDIALAHGVTHYHYAGVSAGGAVGLELLLQQSDSLITTALICTGAKIRSADAWLDRATAVRAEGISSVLGSAASIWFANGFITRNPDAASALLASLRDTDAGGYAAVCEALAHFDVRHRLPTITGDVTVIAGAQDIATPPESMRTMAQRIPAARYLELAAAAHLAPAEQPDLITQALMTNPNRSTT